MENNSHTITHVLEEMRTLRLQGVARSKFQHMTPFVHSALNRIIKFLGPERMHSEMFWHASEIRPHFQ